jgi:hypothetical protein
MKKKAWQAVAAIPLTLALAACGGGGDGSSSSSSSSSSGSTAGAFNLQAGVHNLLMTGLSANASLSGTVAGIAVSGSGTYTVQPGSSTTFNGGSALSQATTINGTFTVATQTDQYTAITIDYFSASDSAFLGEVDQSTAPASEYDVAGTPIQWPTSLTAGDSGDLGKVQRYTDSTQSVPIGSVDVSYSAAASGSALVVTITTKSSDASGNLQETVELKYNLSSANKLSLVSYSGEQVAGNSLTFTAD